MRSRTKRLRGDCGVGAGGHQIRQNLRLAAGAEAGGPRGPATVHSSARRFVLDAVEGRRRPMRARPASDDVEGRDGM